MSLRLLILYLFTILIFQYFASEEQVAVVLYGEDIEKYADKLTPFSTYLISTAKVRVPLPYGVPISRFEWVIDKFTVVEEVKDDNIQDPPLPPPPSLNTVPFAYLHEQQRNMKFDIVAVVVNCGSIKYVGANSSKCPEVVVMDTKVKDNRPRLMRYTQQTEVDSSLVLAANQDDIVPIAAIQSQPHKHLFYVEGKLSFPTAYQDFYELLCSHCGQQYRTHSPKIIHCASCKQRAMLTPRARFEVVMTDASGSTVATLIGELGEKFLDMTAADIYEISAKVAGEIELASSRRQVYSMMDLAKTLASPGFCRATGLARRGPKLAGKLAKHAAAAKKTGQSSLVIAFI
ncbi:hypothetical protein A4A49_01369 [Nicotiana attenuata]|uniref:Replication factor A C-terminal domain-containing protein n=1 Tax=Nicotiana attenuata TaxID=49451 RepID=A0A1J6IR73_NICAT|nr:hypothetical protein A4A49_01369 [Nicotiana attenuata]